MVTGANRGIGREVCAQLHSRGFDVVLGARDQAAAERAANEDGSGSAHHLDVSDDESVTAFAGWLSSERGRLDVLVNNAGVQYDTWQSASSADLEVVHEALEVNVIGAWRTSMALLPLMEAGGADRQRLQRRRILR